MDLDLELVNEQDIELDCEGLQRSWKLAAKEILNCSPGPLGSSLAALDEVCFVLLNDQRIAQVHGEFLDDPRPTDVITFHHGEILISVDTAQRVGETEGTGTFVEVLLYGVHGLVHLHGFDDHSAEERAIMAEIQEPIVERLL